MKRKARLVLLALALGGAAAGVAWSRPSGTTIGETFTAPVPCGLPAYSMQLFTHPDVSYVVPSGRWRVDSWSTDGGPAPTGEIGVMVFRPLGGGNYMVVGESPAVAVTAGPQTHPISIDVQGGELLGLWEAEAPCAVTTVNEDDELDSGLAASEPAVGDTVTPSTAVSGVRLDIEAHLDLVAVAQPAREAYCMPKPVLRADGTTGTFVDLLAGQPDVEAAYAGAMPALYGQGYGLTCDNLAGLGYKDAGYRVDGSGAVDPDAAGNLYEFFTK